ncbi:MAG: hypothetical protein ACKVQU_24815 [Burkholderiales bacterium]
MKRPILGQLHDEDMLEELFVVVIGFWIDGSRLQAFPNGLDGEAVAIAGKGVNVLRAAQGKLHFGQAWSPAKVFDGQLFPDRAHRIGNSSLAHLSPKVRAKNKIWSHIRARLTRIPAVCFSCGGI